MSDDQSSWLDRFYAEVREGVSDDDEAALADVSHPDHLSVQLLLANLASDAIGHLGADAPPPGIDGRSLPREVAELLGRNLVACGRTDISQLPDSDPRVEALMALRWGADELDDEAVWTAALAAVELLADDSERWLFGDGFVDESIKTRPELWRRWQAEFETNPQVRAVHRAMEDSGDW